MLSEKGVNDRLLDIQCVQKISLVVLILFLSLAYV
jgi:hypothetical protein